MTTGETDSGPEAAVQETYAGYLAALLRGDRSHCRDTVQRLLDAGVDLRSIYVGLFQRALYAVGDMWEKAEISVATEHLATSTTESLFSLVYPQLFRAERAGRCAVVSCVANEYHQIGGKMVADVFELNGWDGYFLGASASLAEVRQAIEERQPDYLGLSLAVYGNLGQLREALATLTRQYEGLPVLIGGQAFRWGGSELEQEYPYVTHIASLAALEELITGPAGQQDQHATG